MQKVLSAGAVGIALLLGATIAHAEYTDVTLTVRAYIRGVDLSVIALWLGHESTDTTEVYLHADMRLKERALAHPTTSGVVPRRYAAPDRLLAFLEGL